MGGDGVRPSQGPVCLDTAYNSLPQQSLQSLPRPDPNPWHSPAVRSWLARGTQTAVDLRAEIRQLQDQIKREEQAQLNDGRQGLVNVLARRQAEQSAGEKPLSPQEQSELNRRRESVGNLVCLEPKSADRAELSKLRAFEQWQSLEPTQLPEGLERLPYALREELKNLRIAAGEELPSNREIIKDWNDLQRLRKIPQHRTLSNQVQYEQWILRQPTSSSAPNSNTTTTSQTPSQQGIPRTPPASARSPRPPSPETLRNQEKGVLMALYIRDHPDFSNSRNSSPSLRKLRELYPAESKRIRTRQTGQQRINWHIHWESPVPELTTQIDYTAAPYESSTMARLAVQADSVSVLEQERNRLQRRLTILRQRSRRIRTRQSLGRNNSTIPRGSGSGNNTQRLTISPAQTGSGTSLNNFVMLEDPGQTVRPPLLLPSPSTQAPDPNNQNNTSRPTNTVQDIQAAQEAYEQAFANHQQAEETYRDTITASEAEQQAASENIIRARRELIKNQSTLERLTGQPAAVRATLPPVPSNVDIQRAQAVFDLASIEYDQAEAALMKAPLNSQEEQTATRNFTEAQQKRDAAGQYLERLTGNPAVARPEVQQARVDLDRAQQKVREAKVEYEKAEGEATRNPNPRNNNERSKAEEKLKIARYNRNMAQRQLNILLNDIPDTGVRGGTGDAFSSSAKGEIDNTPKKMTIRIFNQKSLLLRQLAATGGPLTLGTLFTVGLSYYQARQTFVEQLKESIKNEVQLTARQVIEKREIEKFKTEGIKVAEEEARRINLAGRQFEIFIDQKSDRYVQAHIGEIEATVGEEMLSQALAIKTQITTKIAERLEDPKVKEEIKKAGRDAAVQAGIISLAIGIPALGASYLVGRSMAARGAAPERIARAGRFIGAAAVGLQIGVGAILIENDPRISGTVAFDYEEKKIRLGMIQRLLATNPTRVLEDEKIKLFDYIKAEEKRQSEEPKLPASERAHFHVESAVSGIGGGLGGLVGAAGGELIPVPGSTAVMAIGGGYGGSKAGSWLINKISPALSARIKRARSRAEDAQPAQEVDRRFELARIEELDLKLGLTYGPTPIMKPEELLRLQTQVAEDDFLQAMREAQAAANEVKNS